MKNICRNNGCRFCKESDKKDWRDGTEDFAKYHMTAKMHKAIKITIRELEKI